MKVLYGCCYKADLELDFIDYVDIIPGLTKAKGSYFCKDIKTVNFSDYDIILCSPPCNYYSRCNYRRDTSLYALSTKDLLPYCINEAYKTGKPFIIENVRNKRFMYNLDIPKDILIFEYGRHTYFTNVLFNIRLAAQRQDFKNGGYVIRYPDMKNTSHQGGFNVNNVFKCFLYHLLDLPLDF